MKTVFHLILILLTASCGNTYNAAEEAKEIAAFRNVQLDSVTKLNKSIITPGIFFPSMNLINGQTLTVHFYSRGCFHYYNDTILINKQAENFIVTYIKNHADSSYKIVTDSIIDLSFQAALETFAINCKKNILNSKKVISRKNMILSTTHEWLTILDGLHQIHVPIGIDDIDPFNKLRLEL